MYDMYKFVMGGFGPDCNGFHGDVDRPSWRDGGRRVDRSHDFKA